MPHVFVHRFERFSAGMQIILAVIAFAIALTLGAFIPSVLFSVLVTFFALTPLSILLVVAVASSVQRARNTVKATELDTVLSDARQVHHDVPPPSLTPDWRDALNRISDRRERVMAIGHLRWERLRAGDMNDIAAFLKGKPERALVEEEVAHLSQLQTRHSGVDNAEVIRRVRNRLYLLIGKAVTGEDVEAMAALVELDRDFIPFTNCQIGHWDVHNLDGVYTVPGGQRRVKRACSSSCGSRWSEKI